MTTKKIGRFVVTRGSSGVDSGTAGPERPPRDLIYGLGGTGRTTLAADYPSPIFVGEEEGAAALEGENVERFDPPTCWEDVLGILEALRVERHDRQTVVIEPVETIEVLIHRDVARAHGVRSIEDVGQYKRGLTEALGYWHELARRLEQIGRARGMGVVLISRAVGKTTGASVKTRNGSSPNVSTSSIPGAR